MAKILFPLTDAPRLALSGIKTFHGMEGTGLNATLYFDSRRVADVIDSGNGGEVLIRFATRATESAVADYVESLRLVGTTVPHPQPGRTPFTYPCDLETLINRTVDAYNERKILVRHSKTKVLFRLPTDTDGIWRTIRHNGQIAKAQAWVQEKYPEAIFFSA